MKIEELRIGQVVYNTDNEKLTVEVISAERNCEPKVYACEDNDDKPFVGKWYHPAELQERPMQLVDLGLPSGTRWNKDIERDYHGEPVYMSYNEAKATFKNDLPKSWQFAELHEECEWKWENHGYRVIGPNGNSIFLPAAGRIGEDLPDSSSALSCVGYYWSSRVFNMYDARCLYFSAGGIFPYDATRCTYSFTIILCKTK